MNFVKSNSLKIFKVGQLKITTYSDIPGKVPERANLRLTLNLTLPD